MTDLRDKMRQGEEIKTLVDALRLGITLSARTRLGDRITLGTSRIYRNKARKAISSEYTLTQAALPSAAYTTNDVDSIARLAVEHSGKAIVNEARLALQCFLMEVPRTLN